MQVQRATPVIPGSDLKAHTEFWCDVVGFEKQGEFPGFVILGRDDMPLYLSEVPDETIPRHNMLWIRVDDVESWRSHLIDKGVSQKYSNAEGAAITKITDEPWGRDFALRDPSGNCVHFYAEV